MRPYILAETTWAEVKQTDYELAILPWGATEAHNYHLPYATDNIQAEAVVYAAAGEAWEAGKKVIVLPTLPFGVNTGQADIKLDINLNPSTQLVILDDIIATLVRHGIPKLLVYNGHGGNDFKTMLRELGLKYPDIFLCTTNFFRALPREDYFSAPGDHADELETSLMLHVHPNLVRPLEQAGDGRENPPKISAFREGWVWAERKWSAVTADTGVGDPARATPEKGARYFRDLTTKFSQLFQELVDVDPKEFYVREQQ